MFEDRADAGKKLAERLIHYKDRGDVIVLALPRGGVVTGFEIASALHAPLDVLIVRKIGLPDNPELAMGAVAETGAAVWNSDVVRYSGLSEEELRQEVLRGKEEIARRAALYRNGRRLPDLSGKTVILVDDGVATGATIKASIPAIRGERAAKIVLALPVGPPATAEVLRRMVDEFLCLETPGGFSAVGQYYADFTQVTDSAVVGLLKRSGSPAAEE